VINVDGVPAEYGNITVRNKRTNDLVTIPDTDAKPLVEENPGIPYAFKANEKVSKNHPAVKASPGSFISLEEAEDDE
jgi:hypothetical protein